MAFHHQHRNATDIQWTRAKYRDISAHAIRWKDTGSGSEWNSLKRVREEKKFESPEALKAQILRDVQQAKTYFRRRAALQGIYRPV